MLQSLRDKAQGWITWVIVGLIAITFIFFGMSSLFTSGGESTVAKVSGTKITERELETSYQRFLHQPGSESLRNLDPDYVKKELLQSLIDATILSQTTARIGMKISSVSIQDALMSISFLNEDGHFSPSLYARFLASSDFTDQSFRKLIKESLIKQQLQLGLVQTVIVLPNDIETLVKYYLQKRDFHYIKVEAAAFAKNITIADDTIKQYYEQHLNDFLTNEQVALEYIHLSPQDLMGSYQPQAKDLEHYYEENLSLFSTPEKVHVAHILVALPKDADAKVLAKAQARIKEIQQKLQAGTPFATLAKEYSEDKGSAPAGGDLEWFTKGEMLPEFETAAFALDKNNNVSKPVRTEFGFHIIHLIDKQNEKARPFASVKDEIVTKLKEQWAQEQLANLADQLSTLAFEHPDTLQPAEDKLGLKIQKTESFDQQTGPKQTLLQNPAVTTVAFSTSVKEDKNNSDLIKLDDENFIVLRAAEYYPSKQKLFSDVKEEIKMKLMGQEAEKLAKAQAEKIYATPQEPQNKWQDAENITRTSKDLDSDLIEAAFTMSRPVENKLDLKITPLGNGDYAVIWLNKVQDGDMATLSAQGKESYETALARHWGELEYSLYTTELFKRARIKEYLQ